MLLQSHIRLEAIKVSTLENNSIPKIFQLIVT